MHLPRVARTIHRRAACRGRAALLAALSLAGCAAPLQPWNTATTPQMRVPAIQHQGQDRRARFREILCAVLAADRDGVPDYRPCDDALTRLGDEPAASGAPVRLGPARRPLKAVFVPGLGWDCFAQWLNAQDSIPAHLRAIGYDMQTLAIEGLAGSAHNARRIRDLIIDMPHAATTPDLVLIGYSKGAVDTLEALAEYPELRPRIAAVVSVAGAVGGSPLANTMREAQLDLMRYFPGATCRNYPDGALADLRPDARQAWLASHALVPGVRYYSLITYPEPARISGLLQGSYRKLARVDARNDSQLIFYDQFIPGSALMAYLNADHWAVALPIARGHALAGATLIEQNAYPREALYESVLRLIEEDLLLDTE